MNTNPFPFSSRAGLLVMGFLFIALPNLSGFLQAADQPGKRQNSDAVVNLESSFRSPPTAARPWAYYWWLNANVTRESITRDLEQMKEKGLGGFLLFDVTAYGQQIVPSPKRNIKFLSPPWRQLVKHTMSEANRLGLAMSMNLSTCGGALRAPWPTGEQAPKSLVWTSVDVVGPRPVKGVLPRLQGPQAWDIALLAVRIGSQDQGETLPGSEQVRFANDPRDWQQVIVKPKDRTPVTEVVELTTKIDSQGQFRWEVPAGRWRLIRFLFTVMKEAESDVDMLDARAVETHFNRFGKTILEDAGPLAGKTLSHF